MKESLEAEIRFPAGDVGWGGWRWAVCGASSVRCVMAGVRRDGTHAPCMKQTPTTPPLWPVSVRSHSQEPMRQTRMQRSSEPEMSRSLYLRGERARGAFAAGRGRLVVPCPGQAERETWRLVPRLWYTASARTRPRWPERMPTCSQSSIGTSASIRHTLIDESPIAPRSSPSCTASVHTCGGA